MADSVHSSFCEVEPPTSAERFPKTGHCAVGQSVGTRGRCGGNRAAPAILLIIGFALPVASENGTINAAIFLTGRRTALTSEESLRRKFHEDCAASHGVAAAAVPGLKHWPLMNRHHCTKEQQKDLDGRYL